MLKATLINSQEDYNKIALHTFLSYLSSAPANHVIQTDFFDLTPTSVVDDDEVRRVPQAAT